MKTLIVVIFTVLLNIYVSGYLIKVPTVPGAAPTVITNSQWTHLQKLMIPLFENVCEVSSNPIIQRLAKEFTLEPSNYLAPEVLTDLQNLMSTGLLPKGTIFSENDPKHMNELKIIYKVLYNANNFDTFYNTAAWARQKLNCALYVNALYLAIQNRRDTERLSIPAPYELLPNYFIDKNVIIKASSIFAGEQIVPSDNIHYEGNVYTIDANYTALFYDEEDDSKLAYFREDIGLNTYYFLRKLKMAPWFNNDVSGSFGENMYQMMKQLMARYNLERYANGLPELESLDWSSLNDIPYDPMLIYLNGNDFDHRTSSLKLPENEDISLLQTIETNIVALVSHMRQSGYNKSQILNHLMEVLVTSEKSYETLARQLLGKDFTSNGYGSVLDHYVTSLRDPIFWMINKKIVDMVDEGLKLLTTYTRNELYFPGVEIVNVDVKKMTTAYDYFAFDVTDALSFEDSDSKFKIKIGQPRLNHKPFTIKVNITSLVSQKGMMKIYLGPKVMPGELIAKKNLFTLLDIFEVTLKKGSNIISRASDSMKQFSEDFMSLDTIRKKVEDAEFGLDSLPFKTIEAQTGYPSRLILPKGIPEGLPIQMFVFVAPYIKADLSTSKSTMEFNTAVLSPGYPLDLMIEDKQLFELPNAIVKYFTVTQKSDSKIENYGGPGISKSWSGTNTYEPSSRPDYSSKTQYNTNYGLKVNEFNVGVNDFTPDDNNLKQFYSVNALKDDSSNTDFSSKAKLREPFDYKAKKAQYNKKEYSTKNDYVKYQINPTTEEYITTDHVLNNFVRENDYNAERDYAFENKEMPIDTLEMLPQPSMLKKDSEENEKFNYKAKKTERDYLIKSRKTELDNLIKVAKNYRKIVSTSTEKTKLFDIEEHTGRVILNKDIIFDDRIISNTKSKFTGMDSEKKYKDAKDSIKISNKFTKNVIVRPEDKYTAIKREDSIENEDTLELNKNVITDDTNIDRTDIVDTDSLENYSEEDPKSYLDNTKRRTPMLFDYILHTITNTQL